MNHKLEKQKKLQKAAEKRKKAKAPPQPEEDENEVEEDEEAGGSDLEIDEFDDAPEEIPQEEVAAKLAELQEKRTGQADGWETDVSEEEDEEDDEDDEDEEDGGIDLALDDESDSDSEIETAPKLNGKSKTAQKNGVAEDEDDEEDEDEDIPMSDIESLASEDRADVVPHQRLTINNTAALQRALKSFALPSNLPFSAVQSVTSAAPVAIADVDDDLNRELAFYRQSLDAVTEARQRLKKEGVPFTRPADYFAEMVKSEEQMGKVRSKMLDEAARKKASADARRQRDLKKFGKAVQVAKLQERQKEKRETMDRINTLKRSKCHHPHIHFAFEIRTDFCFPNRTPRRRPDRQRRRHVRRRAQGCRRDGAGRPGGTPGQGCQRRCRPEQEAPEEGRQVRLRRQEALRQEQRRPLRRRHVGILGQAHEGRQ